SSGEDGGHGKETLAPCLFLFWRRAGGRRRLGTPLRVVDDDDVRLVGAAPGRGDDREELAGERTVDGKQEVGDLLLLRPGPSGEPVDEVAEDVRDLGVLGAEEHPGGVESVAERSA